MKHFTQKVAYLCFCAQRGVFLHVCQQSGLTQLNLNPPPGVMQGSFWQVRYPSEPSPHCKPGDISPPVTEVIGQGLPVTLICHMTHDAVSHASQPQAGATLWSRVIKCAAGRNHTAVVPS